MNRFTAPAVCACLVLGLTACGEAPPADATSVDIASPGPGLQQVSFTGVGDPATGRLQIFMGPQAAIGTIAEDSDGSASTVAANTAQVYNPAAATFIAHGGTGFPATCLNTAAFAMVADVEVWSGFTEQLRNVYVRINGSSAGLSFCNSAAPGAIAPPAGTYSGLYFYQPLNAGTAPSAIRRMATTPWNVNIPSSAPFYFSGDVWAEVIPAPPIIGATTSGSNPADDSTIQVAGGSSRQNFTWTNDPRADGGTSGEASYAVARPTGGASLTVLQCGSAGTAAAPIAFNSALCTTYLVNPRLFTLGTTNFSRRYNAGNWYQWSLQASFLLPGSTTRTLGSTVQTRHFAVVNP